MDKQTRMRCTFLTDYKRDDLNPPGKRMWFDTEGGKGTAFFLNLKDNDSIINVDKPCHIIVDCCQYNSETNENETGLRQPWLFGGMEIHSNAKNIEVYATPEGSTSDDQYWKTCPGMQIQDADDSDDGLPRPSAVNPPKEKKWQKTIILPPSSKPTSLKVLHLKLLSLRPVKCTVGSIRNIKMKGRIYDTHSVTLKSKNDTNEQRKDYQAEQDDKITSSPPIPIQNYKGGKIQTNQMVNKEDSTSDISKAVSALSMHMRIIQSDMKTSISSSIGEMQKVGFIQNQSLAQRVTKIEKNLGNIQEMLVTLLSEVRTNREEVQAQEEARRIREEIVKKETDRELTRSRQKQDASLKTLMEDQRTLLVQETAMAQKEILESMVDKILNSRGIEKEQHVSSQHNHGLCPEEMNHNEAESSDKNVTVEENALFIDRTKYFEEFQVDEQQDFKLKRNGEKNDSTEDIMPKDVVEKVIDESTVLREECVIDSKDVEKMIDNSSSVQS